MRISKQVTAGHGFDTRTLDFKGQVSALPPVCSSLPVRCIDSWLPSQKGTARASSAGDAAVGEKSKVPQISAAFAKHSAESQFNISISPPRSRENNPIRIGQPSAKGRFSMNAITSATSKLGFAGVGYMGRPIPRRVPEAGFKLAAYDRDRNQAQELIRYGGAVPEGVAARYFSFHHRGS